VIGRITLTEPLGRGMGSWARESILGQDGCLYPIAAADRPPKIVAGNVVRFDVAGSRAVNIEPVGRR